MAKHKRKDGNQDRNTKIVILITAALNLVKALIDLINNLAE